MSHTLRLLTEAHEKAIDAGTKREMEHTSDKKVAAKIAKDHLDERPDYYEKLDDCMKEENLTELSQQVLQNYKMKANKEIARKQGETGAFGTRRTNAPDKFHGKRAVTDYEVIGRRKDGIAKANKRLVKEDTEIVEVSKQLMGRYIDAAKYDVDRYATKRGMYNQAANTSKNKSDASEYRDQADKNEKKGTKRLMGIGMAARKLVKEDVDVQEGAKKNGIHKQIRKAVDQHDLTHMMSDDPGVYRKGREEVADIEQKSKRIPKANFRRIWNKNADKKLRKPDNQDFHIKEDATFIGTKNPDPSGKPKPIYSIYQKLIRASVENTATDATKDFAKRNDETLKNTTSHYNPNAGINKKL